MVIFYNFIILGQNFTITIPKTVLSGRKYVQLITVASFSSFYSTKGINPGSSLKTGMIRVSMNDAFQIMRINETDVQSTQMIISNLTIPIEITIPFSGTVPSKMTLDCVYSQKSGDIISSDGIIRCISNWPHEINI